MNVLCKQILLKMSWHNKERMIRVCFCSVIMRCFDEARLCFYFQQYTMELVELGFHKVAMNLACLPVHLKPTERKLFIIIYYYYHVFDTYVMLIYKFTSQCW